MPTEFALKLLLLDDQRLFRESLSLLLRRSGQKLAVLPAENLAHGIDLASQHPDMAMAVLVLRPPEEECLAMLQTFCHQFPRLRVAALSDMEEPSFVRQTLNLGAKAFISQTVSLAQLFDALHRVLAGGGPLVSRHNGSKRPVPVLTPRQLQVLTLVAKGHPNKEIAGLLHMASNTVRVHLVAIFEILEVSSRTEAAVKALALGLVAKGGGF